jgi:hypothetical protein
MTERLAFDPLCDRVEAAGHRQTEQVHCYRAGDYLLCVTSRRTTPHDCRLDHAVCLRVIFAIMLAGRRLGGEHVLRQQRGLLRRRYAASQGARRRLHRREARTMKPRRRGCAGAPCGLGPLCRAPALPGRTRAQILGTCGSASYRPAMAYTDVPSAVGTLRPAAPLSASARRAPARPPSRARVARRMRHRRLHRRDNARQWLLDRRHGRACARRARERDRRARGRGLAQDGSRAGADHGQGAACARQRSCRRLIAGAHRIPSCRRGIEWHETYLLRP